MAIQNTDLFEFSALHQFFWEKLFSLVNFPHFVRFVTKVSLLCFLALTMDFCPFETQYIMNCKDEKTRATWRKIWLALRTMKHHVLPKCHTKSVQNQIVSFSRRFFDWIYVFLCVWQPQMHADCTGELLKTKVNDKICDFTFDGEAAVLKNHLWRVHSQLDPVMFCICLL